MKSPYKYIGENCHGVKVLRTDLIVLDALSRCERPITTDALIEIADPRNAVKLTVNDTIRLLSFMIADSFVERSSLDGERIGWQITPKGKAHLIAAEAQDIFNECARHTPVGRTRRSSDAPRIEEAPAPKKCGVCGLDLEYAEGSTVAKCGHAIHEQLKASHEQIDNGVVSVSTCDHRELAVPETALLCVDEDELDAWWQSMDVEMKADAFAGFALHMYDRVESHIYAEPPSLRVPVMGTVGDLSDELKTKIGIPVGGPREAVR